MSRTRVTVMTISKIESEMINTSSYERPSATPGYTWVEATDGSESHRWHLADDRRCFIGDRVEVVIVDEDPVPFRSDRIEPPPLAKPFSLDAGDTLTDASTGRTWRYDGKQWIETA